MSLGIKSPANKDKWQNTTVLSILSNEKYKGAALLQKRYVEDFLTKKVKPNLGELPQYYIEDAHEAIISPIDWDIVQEEIAHRKSLSGTYSANSVLSSKLICEDCGSYYGSKVWHSNDPYRKIIYRCNKKYANNQKCSTPTLTEDEVKDAFLKAYNKYIGNREQIISDATLLCDVLSDTSSIDSELAELTSKLEETAKEYRLIVAQSSSNPDFQSLEQKTYSKYLKLHDKKEKLSNKKSEICTRKSKLQNYIEGLKSKPRILEEWDNKLWISMIHHCVVHKDKTITFVFRDETQITI